VTTVHSRPSQLAYRRYSPESRYGGPIFANSVLTLTAVAYESYWGVLCGANLWFGGFPYPVNPGRPEWSKVQTRGKPLVSTSLGGESKDPGSGSRSWLKSWVLNY